MAGICVTIMAGGLGKRMNSTLPKVLHKVNGIPMIVRTISNVLELNPHKIMIVVGKNKNEIKDVVSSQISFSNIEYVSQDEPLGTGHAIKCTLEHFTEHENDMTNLILCGDTPLLTANTLKELYAKNKGNESLLQITAIQVDDPHGYGRVIMSNSGLCQIIEEKDCTDDQRNVNIVNCSIYFIKVNLLKTLIPLIGNNNKNNEFYLTDIVQFANDKVHVCVLDKSKRNETFNVNNPEQLLYACNICKS